MTHYTPSFFNKTTYHRMIFALGLLFWAFLFSSYAHAKPNLKYASIVIDADTGMVLSQENADRSLHPASLTKIMTMILVFDALDAKKITQKSRLVASSHSASMPPSKVGLRPGQSISVYDALRVLATKSANDVAAIVAENLGGSEGRFVQMMNLKSRSIGLGHTRFVNASGLHDYRQISTARDMAKLAKYTLDTYPRYYSIFGIKNHRYGGKSFHNHNRLMSSYQGMDGIKTGYVAASGFNLVASARRGNTRLIGVVFGGRTAASRNSHMADLLDRGFKKLETIRVAGIQGTKKVTYLAPSLASPVPIPVRKPGTSPLPAYQEQQAATILPDTSSPPVQNHGMKTLKITPVLQEPLQTAETNSYQTLGTITLPAPKAEIASNNNWQIQIGAFEDRPSTDQALYKAMKLLPKSLNKGQTLVIPLRTPEATWIFRGRLAGYSREEAIKACSYLKDCLPISP